MKHAAQSAGVATAAAAAVCLPQPNGKETSRNKTGTKGQIFVRFAEMRKRYSVNDDGLLR